MDENKKQNRVSRFLSVQNRSKLDFGYFLYLLVNTFEKNNGNIDLDKKNFILSMIELPRFRQKVEYIFERFNAFANNYSKYSAIDDQDIQIYSKQIGFARNTIHGQLNEKFDSKKAEEGAMLTIIGLYLYILEDCNASSACQFNLIQCMFSH